MLRQVAQSKEAPVRLPQSRPLLALADLGTKRLCIAEYLVLQEHGSEQCRVIFTHDHVCGQSRGLSGPTLVEQQDPVVAQRLTNPPLTEVTYPRSSTTGTALKEDEQRSIFPARSHNLTRKHLNLTAPVVLTRRV